MFVYSLFIFLPKKKESFHSLFCFIHYYYKFSYFYFVFIACFCVISLSSNLMKTMINKFSVAFHFSYCLTTCVLYYNDKFIKIIIILTMKRDFIIYETILYDKRYFHMIMLRKSPSSQRQTLFVRFRYLFIYFQSNIFKSNRNHTYNCCIHMIFFINN